MFLNELVSAMLPLAKQCSFEEPSVETITAENVLSWPVEVSFFLLLLSFIETVTSLIIFVHMYLFPFIKKGPFLEIEVCIIFYSLTTFSI